MGRHGSTDRLLLLCHICFLTSSTRGFKSVQALTIGNCYLVVHRSLQHLVQIFEGLGHLVKCDVAATSLVESKGGLVDVVCISECFRCIFVRPSSHQQVAGVDMHHWIFLKLQKLKYLKGFTYWLDHD
jgi:hypothetical protein